MTAKRLNPEYTKYVDGQSAEVGNYLGSAHLYGLTATCVNLNNMADYGKRYALIVMKNGLSIYCNTDNTFFASMPWSKSGSDTIPVKSGATGKTSKTISFGVTFPSAPKVVVTKRGTFSDAGIWLNEAITLTVETVSTTGFNLCCTCSSASASTYSPNVSFDWIAML